jgi:hypothetical protein
MANLYKTGFSFLTSDGDWTATMGKLVGLGFADGLGWLVLLNVGQVGPMTLLA